MSEIVFSVQEISDKFQEFKVNSNASASQVLDRVLKDLTKEQTDQANSQEYRVLVAYQLLLSELTLESFLQQLIVKDQSGVLDLIPHIIFVRPVASSARLELFIRGEKYEVIDGQVLSVGRKDQDKNIFPDLDLSRYLDRNTINKVSRELFILKEVEGKWKVELHSNARSSVFVDNYQLKHGEKKDVGDSINVGNSPEEPYIKIITKVLGN